MTENSRSVDESPGPRVIRVFISSTFRDMIRERDLLVKRVIPELRHICAMRLVTFIEVDLRWGITEEQAAEGKVLPLCLDEIRRCRPYFIGLLGERYGWIPDSIPAELIEREPWLLEHLQDRRSVTELEILHGVLNDPEMRSHACFYFRDPRWIDSLPESERTEMLETDTARRDKLAALKDRILRSGYPVENYADPEVLADVVREQFVRLIDRLYPETDVPGELDRETQAHAAYAERKTFGCIDRPGHRAILDDHTDAVEDLKGIVIAGESGSGKTSLLAMWLRGRAKQRTDDLLFAHYFGATSKSGSVDEFLRRLLSELKLAIEIDDEVPREPGELRSVLPLWLARTRGRRIVLVLDGLDQIAGGESDRDLAWLPLVFHPHITVVASSSSGAALDTLSQRGWRVHKLPRSERGEIAGMIDGYLAEFHKTLGPDLRRSLIEAKGSGNPLFLRTVLEELRQFGSFQELPERVAHYLDADDPHELFRRVLRRWQEDFDAGEDLTRRTLRPLWAARRGLSEAEWLDLLGDGAGPLPRGVWTPLLFAMEPHLCNQAGVLAFGHDYLRQAVASEFLSTDRDRQDAHRALADHFALDPEMTRRKSEEWPWQLQESGQWDHLARALLDRRLFEALVASQVDVELAAYWLRLRGARPALQMGRLYLDAFAAWSEKEREREGVKLLAERLGSFLRAGALFGESEVLLRKAVELCEQLYGPDHAELAISLGNLATILQDTDQLPEAERVYRRSLEIYNHLGLDDAMVAASKHNLATLLRDTGRLEEAEALAREALRTYELHHGLEHHQVATALSSLAMILKDTGRFEEAETLSRRALDVCERSLGPSHPSVGTAMIALAGVLIATNRAAAAEPLIRRALENYELSFGPDHLHVATTLSNLVGMLHAIGRIAEAEPPARRALRIHKLSLAPDHPDIASSLNNLGAILLALKRPAEAEPLMREQVEIFFKSSRRAGQPHPKLADALRNYAAVLDALGWSPDRINAHIELLARELT